MDDTSQAAQYSQPMADTRAALTKITGISEHNAFEISFVYQATANGSKMVNNEDQSSLKCMRFGASVEVHSPLKLV